LVKEQSKNDGKSNKGQEINEEKVVFERVAPEKELERMD